MAFKTDRKCVGSIKKQTGQNAYKHRKDRTWWHGCLAQGLPDMYNLRALWAQSASRVSSLGLQWTQNHIEEYRIRQSICC